MQRQQQHAKAAAHAVATVHAECHELYACRLTAADTSHIPPLHLPLIQVTDQLHAAIGRCTIMMILTEKNMPVGHYGCQTQ